MGPVVALVEPNMKSFGLALLAVVSCSPVELVVFLEGEGGAVMTEGTGGLARGGNASQGDGGAAPAQSGGGQSIGGDDSSGGSETGGALSSAGASNDEPVVPGGLAALEEPCETVGQVACDESDISQKLVCSRGSWREDGTCGSGFGCNPATGGCSVFLNECAGLEEGSTFCGEGGVLLACGRNLVSSVLLELCEGLCESQGSSALCGEPFCGDGQVGLSEECDDFGESLECDRDCTAAACGDGYVNSAAGEICDPGTGTTADPAVAVADSAACDSDCTEIVCGDEHVNPNAGEECEPPNQPYSGELMCSWLCFVCNPAYGGCT